MKTLRFSIILCLAAIFAGCIKNDIPYPRIQPNILSITAEGQSRDAAIDSVNRVATLYFPEDANIYAVKITGYTITAGSEIVSGNLDEPIDLASPYPVTLSLYQEYLWKIVGVQEIERHFTVDNQIGAAVIDVPGRRVLVTVSDKANLQALQVISCKLGPSSAVTTPDINGRTVDFTHPVTVSVDNFGHIERWTIYVDVTESTVSTTQADGWTNVAWVYGAAEADKHNTFQYRINGDTEWVTVPDSWVTHNGGAFHARITGLTPNTVYDTRAVSDSEYGEVLTFTTGSIVQLPNSDFENWWLDGKVWCPWAEDGTPYWDTGNKGAATLGQSNSVPTDDTVDGHGRAAMLETKFIGLGMLGKLGAGNIFVGTYVRTDGTNGVLSMGRPFTERPTGVSGYFKYKTAPISSVTAGFENLKGRPDTCSVWCALIDSPEPFEIRTNPKNRQLFDENLPEVVAFGRMDVGYDVPAYIKFHFDLEYKATNRVPRYILLACSASKLGDFFTGGNGAVMCVDDIELTYDYLP